MFAPISLRRLAIALTLATTLPLTGFADPVVARSADSFVDFMGVNVHAHPPYTDKHDMLKARLGELGIRHVRDGDHAQACQYAMEFFNELGIKTTFIMGRRLGGEVEWKSPLDLSKIDAELRDIKELALPATEALEGPNEYDIHSDERDPNWPETLRNYQQQLYTKAKADPALAKLPVIAPSLTSEKAFTAFGDIDASIDRSCAHLYQSTRHPGTGGWGNNGYGSIKWNADFLMAKQSPLHKPLWATECGYNNDLSEAAEAKYLPRMFAEFYRSGFERAFKYELYGQQWGLVREDGSVRPSFTAIKNLIALLKDPGPDFQPAALDFSLSGATKDVRTVLLQKRNGVFQLVVWHEVPSWEVNQKKDLEVAPVAVRLKLGKSNVVAIRTFVATGEMTTGAFVNADEHGVIALEVPDTLMMVELRNAE